MCHEGFILFLGICYVSPTKTVWVAAGAHQVPMYDPKSGDNVSEFIGTFQNSDQDAEKSSLLLLQFVPELNLIIGKQEHRTNSFCFLSWRLQG